jgi:hypothetical protein
LSGIASSLEAGQPLAHLGGSGRDHALVDLVDLIRVRCADAVGGMRVDDIPIAVVIDVKGAGVRRISPRITMADLADLSPSGAGGRCIYPHVFIVK